MVKTVNFAMLVWCVQDSLEDELSTCNESVATEVSFDENLVCNENSRVPFFKVSRRADDSTE